MKNYQFKVERLADIWGEIEPLYSRHWEETEGYQDNELSVDKDRYEELEKQGRLALFTVRTPNGVLCGYLIYVLARNLHTKGEFVASEEGIYLYPAVRGGTLAYRLLKYSEEALKKLGVSRITTTSKAPSGGPDIDKLLRKRGFNPVALQYSKRI